MSQYPECQHGHSNPAWPCPQCELEDTQRKDREYINTLRAELERERQEAAEEIARLTKERDEALSEAARWRNVAKSYDDSPSRKFQEEFKQLREERSDAVQRANETFLVLATRREECARLEAQLNVAKGALSCMVGESPPCDNDGMGCVCCETIAPAALSEIAAMSARVEPEKGAIHE